MAACQSLTAGELWQAAMLARDDEENFLNVIIFLVSRLFHLCVCIKVEVNLKKLKVSLFKTIREILAICENREKETYSSHTKSKKVL